MRPIDPLSASGTPAQPDLNLLRTFLAVYRSGSFTAAAQLLGLSQPTVTTQIRSLERQTRRELFERLPRGVAPTAVADDLAARVAAPSTRSRRPRGTGPGSARAPSPSTWPGPPSCCPPGPCPPSPRSSPRAYGCA